MSYLDKLKEYIEENIIEIEIPDHGLESRFNISNSKLQKDFKLKYSTTLRQYLISKKVELANSLRQGDQNLSLTEIMDKINYNYSERSLRNHLKSYSKLRQHDWNNSNSSDNQFESGVIDHKSNNIDEDEFTGIFGKYFFHNRELFEELFVRLIVLIDYVEAFQNEVNNIVIKQDVEQTIFQLNGLMPDETKHQYDISYTLSNSSLRYSLFVFTEFSDPGQVRVYNSIKPFFNLFYFLNTRFEGHLGYSITKAVNEWDAYIKKVTHVKFMGESYDLDVDLSIKPKLELNRNSEFICKTDSIISHFKQKLFTSIKNQIRRMFAIEYDGILEYLDYVEERKYLEIEQFLKKVDLTFLKRIDFWLRITEFPFLDDINLDSYKISYDRYSLDALMSKPKEYIIETIIAFKRKIDTFDDNDIWEYNKDEILIEIIKSS